MRPRLSTEEWIKRAQLAHGDKYDYSESVYKGSHQQIDIICPVHGRFSQRASHHTEGQGCKKCLSDKQRKSQEDFIKQVHEVHGDAYDYSRVNYRGTHKPVTIICPIHGEFKQKPIKHLKGQGCKRCKGREVWNQEDFLKRARQVHGDRYNYDEVVYVRTVTPVKIKCNRCNKTFDQIPNSHLAGAGCPYCAGNIALTNDAFLELLDEVHGGSIIALTEYESMDKKVLVRHECGREWYVTPGHLIYRKQGCRVCSIKENAMSNEEFIQRLNERHNGEIIALDPYVTSNTPIHVQHKNCEKIWLIEPRVVLRHGCHDCAGRKTDEQFRKELEQVHRGEIEALEPYLTARDNILVRHTCGHEWRTNPVDLVFKEHGCPFCASSKGNKKVAQILSDYGISFIPEKRFETCRYKMVLPFDFYLPDYEILIEYDGQQHFNIVDFWGGEDGLQERQLKDAIKDEWCIDNDKTLYRIRYDESVDQRMKSIIISLDL